MPKITDTQKPNEEAPSKKIQHKVGCKHTDSDLQKDQLSSKKKTLNKSYRDIISKHTRDTQDESNSEDGSNRFREKKSFAQLKEEEQQKELLTAIKNQNEEEVKRLVRKEGYNTNFVDKDDPTGPTPLHIAADKESLKIVKYLLRAKKHRANVNAEDKRLWRPIWYAALRGNPELAEVLTSECKDKCEVNYIDKASGMTPLYRAIISKSSETCRILVHAGADVNMRRLVLTGDSSAAETPLMKAVQLNDIGICEVLVNSLVDLQAKTSGGFTALHYSVAYRRYEITRYLLDERIKIHAKAKNGITAMTVAVAEDLPVMVQILIEYGYNIDKRYQWGETPLEMAIRRHAEECSLIILYWGCSLHLKDRSKPSYFNMACNEGLPKVIQFLVDIKPRFLQEKWLKRRDLPVALYKQEELYEWLFEESANVRSLSKLCYAKIFSTLGKYGCHKIDKLPLPEKLKEWFKFENYFKGDKFIERKYREKSLFTHECPYDCPIVCPRSQCLEIEFSDSGSEYEFYTDSDAESENGTIG